MAEAKKEEKPTPKKPSDTDRIDAIIALLKENGITIPKGLE